MTGGEPVWGLAYLYPPQGDWSEEASPCPAAWMEVVSGGRLAALRRRVLPHPRRNLRDEPLQLIARRFGQTDDEGIDAGLQFSSACVVNPAI